MPIYEYICQDCEKKFEVMRTFKDADAPVSCEKCHSLHTSRLLSMFVAQSGGRSVAGSGSSCSSCSGGSCSTCRN